MTKAIQYKRFSCTTRPVRNRRLSKISFITFSSKSATKNQLFNIKKESLRSMLEGNFIHFLKCTDHKASLENSTSSEFSPCHILHTIFYQGFQRRGYPLHFRLAANKRSKEIQSSSKQVSPWLVKHCCSLK